MIMLLDMNIDMRMYACMHACMDTQIPACVYHHTSIPAYVQTCLHSCTDAHTHTCKHPRPFEDHRNASRRALAPSRIQVPPHAGKEAISRQTWTQLCTTCRAWRLACLLLFASWLDCLNLCQNSACTCDNARRKHCSRDCFPVCSQVTAKVCVSLSTALVKSHLSRNSKKQRHTGLTLQRWEQHPSSF